MRIIAEQHGTLNPNYQRANWIAEKPKQLFFIKKVRDIVKLTLLKEELEKELADSLGIEYKKGFITENLQEFKIWNHEIMRVKLYNGTIVCINADDFSLAKVSWRTGHIVFIFPEILRKNNTQVVCVKMDNGNYLYMDSDFSPVKSMDKWIKH